jgi:hypothetical protein
MRQAGGRPGGYSGRRGHAGGCARGRLRWPAATGIEAAFTVNATEALTRVRDHDEMRRVVVSPGAPQGRCRQPMKEGFVR